MYLQLGALVMALLGLAAQFLHRHNLGKAHFKGLHSLLGLATLVSMEAVGFVGILLYYVIPKARRAQMPRLVNAHKLVSPDIYALPALRD